MTRPAALCALLGLALLTGCRQNVDLDAVREMAAKASAAGGSFELVAQDFHDTCVRKLRWDFFKATAQVAPPADLASIGGPDASHYDAKRCDDPSTTLAVERWQTFNLLYIGYFTALGSIAGAKSDSDANGVKALAVAVERSGRFGTADDVTASAALLGSAVDDYFSYRRRNALSQFADVDGAAFVKKTAAGLINASHDLDGALDEEEQAVNDYYVEAFRHARPGADLATLLTFRRSWSSDLAGVQARRDAVVSYRNAVTDLQAAHAGLVGAISANDPAALAAIVRAYLTEFDPLVEKVHKAFG